MIADCRRPRRRIALTVTVTIGALLGAGPAAATPERGVLVVDGRIRIEVEVARSARAQAKGLSGRSSLKRGTGMLFPYEVPGPRAFWMKGMLIPIDIVWIVRGRIVAIEADVPLPPANGRLPVYSHPADLVLEVPAGYTQETGVRVGQPVEVRDHVP
jgi:uncharacterized membrane protein (UPF0127 family)